MNTHLELQEAEQEFNGSEDGPWDWLTDEKGRRYADAVQAGDAKAVENWMTAAADEKRRRLLGFWGSSPNPSGPLHAAAKNEHIGVVGVLLRWADGCGLKAEVINGQDWVGGNGWTPLLYAVASQREDVAKLLLGNGADTEVRSRLGRPSPEAAWQVGTALHLAVQLGSEAMVKCLLEYNASCRAIDAPNGNTPLHLAESAAVVRLLLATGARYGARNKVGETPEQVAAARLKRLQSLAALFAAFADGTTSLTTTDGWTYKRSDAIAIAQQIAEAKGVVDLLVAQESVNDFRRKTRRDRAWCLTAYEGFHLAAAADNGEEVTRWLTEIGRRFRDYPLYHWRRSDGLTALQAAAADGRVAIVRVILGLGWSADAISPFCMRTPLFFAVAAGHFEVAALLLEHGADVNERQPHPEEMKKDGKVPVTTALHEAVSKGDARMVKLLLAYGANPDARDRRGGTALHTIPWMAFGAESNPSSVVDALVEAGANLLAEDGHGDIPLAAASTAEARLTDYITAYIRNEGVVGETSRQALVRHHLAQNFEAIADARRCLDLLRADSPAEEWCLGLMIKDVKTKSGSLHKAGDVVLLHPCNNSAWDNLMVVRPKPEAEMSWSVVPNAAEIGRHYDNMVLGVRAADVVLVNDQEYRDGVPTEPTNTAH